MSGTRIPSEAPPSYTDAVGSSSSRTNATAGDHLDVPGHAKGGFSAERRRSMEDELRPVPNGWVRTYDPSSGHHFYVDTTADPPRSVWTHPYDDDQYLSTLTSAERERIEEESFYRGQRQSKADIMAAHSEDDDDDHHQASSSSHPSSSSYPDELPPRDNKKGKDTRGFGRKFKDKVTGTTHEERQRERERRAEQERQLYAQHQRIRDAMTRAAQTGEPQYLGKDRDGKDLYVEPPSASGGYGGGLGNYYGGGLGSGYGYGAMPYGGTGPSVRTTPNARFIRPSDPYSRPMGYGYGGGYGLPLAAGLGGGMLGGIMLADMMI